MYFAHIRATDYEKQSVQDHLNGVAYIGRMYGDIYGLGAHAELAGLLHDMGKFTVEFTKYLENSVVHGVKNQTKIDHSTAGAKYLYEAYYDGDSFQKLVVEIIGMAILSHHSGLQNFVQTDLSTSDYIRRVVDKDLPYYDEVKRNFELSKDNKRRVTALLGEAVEEFKQFINSVQLLKPSRLYINYFQKLIFSVLIDADRTDTRRFEEKDDTPLQQKLSFHSYYETMMESIKGFQNSKNPINLLRSQMSDECDNIAENPSNIYTLSIPTGGGKTFASLRYALKHASLYNKKRIIYVVPYTTILEQNAAAVRKILKNDTDILEHHANVIDVVDEEEDYYSQPLHKKMQLGRDNWDYPIIFTTSVQFLNAFFAKGTRNARRMHRLMDAVVIFDEVQSIPYQHFSLFNTAVNFMHYIGGSSILLCTATQPTVDQMKYPIIKHAQSEIVSDLKQTAQAFERVTFYNCLNKEGWNAKEVANKAEQLLMTSQSILIIMNTKAAVKNVYEKLANQEIANVYHLSTSMCPAHRSDILQEIKEKLGKEKVICISTQLIEAGVDISFEVVMRSLAGLDSIAQAAGRCNRHAERDKGEVYLFKSSEENLTHLPEIRIGAEVMLDHIIDNDHLENQLLSPETMEIYFKEFDYKAYREISRKPKNINYELIELINGEVSNHAKTLSISTFKTLEQSFDAIHSPTTPVLVPYGKRGKEMIAELNEDLSLKQLNKKLKEAQQYIVNVFPYEKQALIQNDLMTPLFEERLLAVKEGGYNEKYGLSIEGKGTKMEIQF